MRVVIVDRGPIKRISLIIAAVIVSIGLFVALTPVFGDTPVSATTHTIAVKDPDPTIELNNTDAAQEQIDAASGFNGFATVGWIVGGAVGAIILITIIVFIVRNRRL